MKETLERGYWYSRPPLGFDKFKKGKEHIITVNEKGALLRQAFIWKANEGLTDVQIAERLKSMGLRLHKQKLSEIFHNPFYYGKIRHALLGDSIVEGKQEVLISEEIWNKVNGIETNIGYTHAIETPMYPLKRHIVCSECGCYLTGYEVKAKGLHYYKCNTKGCKSNHNINKLHDLYADLLSNYSIPKELTSVFSKVLTKVFKERNIGQSELKKTLSKELTECNNQIKQVNVKYGLGDIPTEAYNATIETLKEKKISIESELEKSKENLSNLEKFIDTTLLISSNLATLWKDGSFDIRQKLQNLLFPTGVKYNKQEHRCRTINENNVFGIFSKLSTIYENEETKKEPQICDSYRVVAETGLEPVTFGL